MADKMKNIANMAQNYSNKIMGSNCYLIIVYLLSIVFIIIFTYSLYLRKELTKQTKSLTAMKKLNSEYESQIAPLTLNDYKVENRNGLSTTLIDYYVYGSYNSCCTGEVINGYVSIEALKTVINLGVRLLDFEIYFKDEKVVVAAGRNNIYMKDTYNELEIGTVFSEIKTSALSGIQNSSDPLILNFRIVSKNPNVFHILEKKIMKHFSDYLVGKNLEVKYAAQGTKGTVFNTPFKNLKNKVIIFVNDPYKNAADNPGFMELVNACSDSKICDGKILLYNDYQIQNEGSPDTYTSDSKNNFILTTPNVMGSNSKWLMHHSFGIQGVLMNFGGGHHGDALKGYMLKFLEQQKAFILKPANLRKPPAKLLRIAAQNPEMDPTPTTREMSLGPMNVILGEMPGK
jgi:hypothetical protein